MNEQQQEMFDVLCKESGETVTQLFLDYLGLSVLSSDFREFLEDEGYL